jgi:hypothetical protein
MAGEWIKVELHLHEKPEVFQIATATGMDPDTVVGRLLKIWGWASRNCHADGVTHIAALAHLNKIAGNERFAESMQEAGWLELKNSKIIFPNFDRHCSQSAKERGLASMRKAKERVTKMSRSDRDKSVTRVEKRREDITTDLPTREEPVGDLESENAEWLENMRRNFPDRDVDGELKTFQRYCASKGTAANQRGFFGWLKKSSPAIPVQKSQWSY